MIVDDERDIAVYLSTLLEANGFRPTVAESVDSAYELVDQLRPDLICLDIMMPRESGLSMYERLRRDKKLKKIPVMIISGMGQNGTFDFRRYVTDPKIAEPDCFMEKPIEPEQFIQAVNRLIEPDRGKKQNV